MFGSTTLDLAFVLLVQNISFRLKYSFPLFLLLPNCAVLVITQDCTHSFLALRICFVSQTHKHKLQPEEQNCKREILGQYNLEVRYFQICQRKLESFYFSVWALGTLEAKVATSK